MKSKTYTLKGAEKPKYWFMTSIMAKSKVRARMLPGQSVCLDASTDMYEDVMPGKNVTCNKAKRAAYPVGTIFACSRLIKQPGFYNAGTVMIAIESEDGSPLIDEDHTDDEDLLEEVREYYNRYKAKRSSHGFAEGDISDDPETKEAKTKPKKDSFMASLVTRKLLSPTIEKTGFYVDKDIWFLLLRNLQKNKPTIITGPTGCGKTELAALLTSRLKKELHYFNFANVLDPETDLLGNFELSTDEDGKQISYFNRARFTYAIQKPGVLHIDELNRAARGTSGVLFPLLDGKKQLLLEKATDPEERLLDINPELTFLLTANLGAEYTDTEVIDRALTDRMFKVELDYLPVDEEVKLLKRLYDISEKESKAVVSIANTIRNTYKKSELSSGISTRYTREAAELISDGFNTLKAIQTVFLPLFSGSDFEGERSTVKTMISSK